MKKTLVFALTAIVVEVMGLGAQQRVKLSELVTRGSDPVQYLHPRTFNPYTGPVVELYDSSQIVETWGMLRNGTWDGPFESYYMSGQLRSQFTHKDGVEEGPYELYYRDGQLKERGSFRGGRVDGLFESYHPNGRLWEKGYYEDEEVDGLFEAYDEGGRLQFKGEARRGNRCGEWIEYGEGQSYPPCPGSR